MRVTSPAYFFLALVHLSHSDFKEGLTFLICGFISYYFVSCYIALGSVMSIASYILNPPKPERFGRQHPDTLELIGKPVKILYGDDHVIIKMEDIPRVGDIITYRKRDGRLAIAVVDKVTRNYIDNEIMVIVS